MLHAFVAYDARRGGRVLGRLKRIIIILLVAGGVFELLWRGQGGEILRYVFLARFHLTGALLLLALPLICFRIAPALLRSLFDVEAWGVAFAAFFATLLSGVLHRISTTLIHFAPDRFGREPLENTILCRLTEEPFEPWTFPRSSFVLVLPTLIGLVVGRGRASGGLVFRGALALAGFAAGTALTWTTGAVQRRLHGLTDDLDLSFLAETLGPGYLLDGRLRDGHVDVTALLLLTAVVYLAGFWLLKPDARNAVAVWFRSRVPSLCYILILLMLGCWLLPGMAFFFDYYPIPTLIVLAASSFALHVILSLDHYFRISPADGAEALAPDAGLESWLDARRADGDAKPRLVVVAASGGGILAAAWTARVLTGLCERHDGFARNLRLLSGVSGGSVGLLHFVEGLRRTDSTPSAPDLEAVRKAAEASSLEATAWGLAYPDMIRLLAPMVSWFDQDLDRGWAIEQEWRRAFPDGPPSLGEWQRAVAAGTLPAAVFNATTVETGERLILSPVRLREAGEDRRMTRHFHDAYPGHDVSLVTAARLSAAFPYVSPVSRARPSDRREVAPEHYTDGGYFDNFGMVSAIEWMESILPDHHEQLGGVLLLQIRAGGTKAGRSDDSDADVRGWLYTLLGPLLALLNVRGSTQAARGDLEARLLMDRWKDRLPFETAVFEYDQPGPLSWELKPQDSDALAVQWKRYADGTDEEAREAMEALDRIVAG